MKVLSSPNFDDRPLAVDTIVIHHTEMSSSQAAIQRLCDPLTKVSAHYVISKNGEVFQLVHESKRAWHAGKSYWRGKEALNDNSIGIELDNDGKEKFTFPQMQSLLNLCKGIIKRHSIKPCNIVGHSDIAPDRKVDPHHLFDWGWLANQGVGLFPASVPHTPNVIFEFGDSGHEVSTLQNKLARFGYGINLSGKFDVNTEIVVKSFNRHFCPESFLERLENTWTETSEQRLNALLEMIDGKD
jgi:N-acetylmuramoyl-L-alanine amidase